MASEVERRSSPRFARSDISVELMDPMESQVLDATPALQDISQGGAALKTKAEICAGEAVRFELHLPGGRTASGMGRVRWVAQSGEALTRLCGIQFTDIAGGGSGQLALALAGAGSSGFGFNVAGAFDAALMAACVIVVLLLAQNAALQPDTISRLSGALAETIAPIFVIGGAALGIFLCLRR